MGLSLKKIGDSIRDIFDANTAADQQRRLAAGQPRYYADQQNQLPASQQRPINLARRYFIPSAKSTYGNPANYRDAAVSVGRGFARIPETASRSFVELTGGQPMSSDEVYQINDPVRKFLYGQEPIQTYQKRAQGVSLETAKPGGLPTIPAPFIALGTAGMDLAPGGKGKPKLPPKVVAKNVPKQVALFPPTGLNQATAPKTVEKTVPKTVDSTTHPVAKTRQVSMNVEKLNIPQLDKSMLKTATTKRVPIMTNQIIRERKGSVKAAGKAPTFDESATIIAAKSKINDEVQALNKKINEARIAGDETAVKELLRQSFSRGGDSTGHGTHTARELAARRMMASDIPPDEMIRMKLRKHGVTDEQYAERFAKVDPNDANAVVKAYRDLAPAKVGEWVDAYRYTNMLSSFKTHSVNVASNILAGTTIRPLTTLVAGGLDAGRATITGGKRTRFAGEAGHYYSGYVKAIDEAWDAWKDVMSGRSAMRNPDMKLDNLPLAVGGAKGALSVALNLIPKLMEAADQFGVALVKGGETAALQARLKKGVRVRNIEKKAEETAQYTLFRQQLKESGQGHILNTLSYVPNKLDAARRHKEFLIRWPAKIMFPFIVTPTNLFKQGVEYSPLGFTTLLGSPDKTAQAAKAIIGTTAVTLTATALAQNGSLTFSEPTNPEQRNAFRAEGKQPYSVNIGGRWIQYSKLHPAIAFNMAAVAAVKQGLDEGTIDEDGAEQISNIAASMLGFYRDQTYMKAVGDFTSILQYKDGMDASSIIPNTVANAFNQYVPLRSAISWLGRQVDPTQRRVDTDADIFEKFYQQVVRDIPGLNQSVPERKSPFDKQPIKSDNPVFNAFSPVSVTNDRGYGNTTGLNTDQRMAQKEMPESERKEFRDEIIQTKGENKLANKEMDKIKENEGDGISQLANGKFYAKLRDGEYKSYDTKEKAELAVAKAQFEDSDEKSKVVGDRYLYKSKDGKVHDKPKVLYDFEQDEAKLNLELDRAYERKDVNGWLGLAQKKYYALEAKKQLFDPDTEQDEINKIILQQENLMDKAAGYAQKGIGGSGGSGGRGGSRGIRSALEFAVSANAGGTIARPTVSVKGGGGTIQTKRATASGKPKVTIKKSKV